MRVLRAIGVSANGIVHLLLSQSPVSGPTVIDPQGTHTLPQSGR
jgi:hypothetical protein